MAPSRMAILQPRVQLVLAISILIVAGLGIRSLVALWPALREILLWVGILFLGLTGVVIALLALGKAPWLNFDKAQIKLQGKIGVSAVSIVAAGVVMYFWSSLGIVRHTELALLVAIVLVLGALILIGVSLTRGVAGEEIEIGGAYILIVLFAPLGVLLLDVGLG